MTTNSNETERVRRKNTKSIKRQTSLWYTYLYLIIATISVAVLCVSVFYYTYGFIHQQNGKIRNSVTQSLEKDNSIENIKKTMEAVQEEYSNTVLALIDSSGNYYLTKDNKRINEYLKGLEDNLTYDMMPRASLLHRGYLVSSRDITVKTPSGNYSYRLMVFSPAASFLEMMYVTVPPISIMLAAGAFFVLILGRMKLGRVLAPINEMNATTRRITAENLDLRLDVSNAEYELKELAQTTNEMIDSFQRAYEQQQQFVSDVSHELRTPISVISGYANMLKRWGAEDEEILKESVDSIIFESENMKNLVNRLLILARHDRKNLSYNMEDLNFTESIDLVVRDLEVTNPEIQIKYSSDPDIFITADEFRIIEAVRVFIDNAIKYSSDSPVLEIRLEKADNNAVLTIKDNGIGISAEDLPKIFDRFYRSDKSRNKETGGTGLGLSIAKIIIRDHGGKITVRSKENVGSEFIITLPLRKEGTENE